jgi:anhydro-N-acetylmuramic acid kinase
VANGAASSAQEISQLHALLGRIFGQAALSACREFRVSMKRVALIGSHGQTIFHQGRPARFLGQSGIASSLQIGDPSVIAQLTGIPAVGDFRTADMAAGGHGAPLVPFVDYLLFRSKAAGRVALNIGGIANVTVIPANARPEQVFAFDTGPGNMVMDALARHFTRGRHTYDKNAHRALRGKLIPSLLQELKRERYFSQRPPKSCGREQFGSAFASRIIAWGKAHGASPENLMHTAAALTSSTILDALRKFVLPQTSVKELILSGGGAKNPLLVEQLKAGLGSLKNAIALLPSSELGIGEDGKEAFAFAVLAYQTWRGRPANLPRATGARCPVILGKLCLAGRR